ncbi:MAG: hypothetical protein ACRD0K_17745 [Egibacteraceae bacterium]
MSHEGDLFLRLTAEIAAGKALVFIGEMQLAGWGDSHNGGAKIVLWLPDADHLGPFRDLTARKGKLAGQRLMVVMMEVNDDESMGGAPAIQRAAQQFTGLGPAGMWLVARCRELEFRKWLAETHKQSWNECWKALDLVAAADRPEATARLVVKRVLGVDSRKDVDGNEKAMEVFNVMRVKYAKHLEES